MVQSGNRSGAGLQVALQGLRRRSTRRWTIEEQENGTAGKTEKAPETEARAAIDPIEQDQERMTFVVRTGNTTEEVVGRTAAIGVAKEMSAKTWRPIGLESEDGRVKMQFQRGSLQTYRFDTGERR